MTRFKTWLASSLSHRLMLFSFLFTYALLLSFLVLMFFTLNESLKREDVAILKDRVKTLEHLLDMPDDDRLQNRVRKEWHGRDFERIFVRILNAQNLIVVESPDLVAQHASVLGLFDRLASTQRNQPVREALGDITYQAMVHEVKARGQNYLIEAALDRSYETTLLDSLKLSFMFLLVIGGFGSLWIGRAVIKIALKPVREISTMAANMNSERLSERIAPETLPQEFREVAAAMNSMLDRLEDAFERLGRFSDDMAHELRTPVNNLLGSMQVTLQRERSPEDYRNLIGSGIEECDRLKRIIESLLFIARTAEPGLTIDKRRLQLNDELTDIVSFYEASAEERGLKLQLECDNRIEILAERTHLQRGIGNLISNSIRHSPEGSTIRLHVEARENELLLKVIDQGSGIPQSALSRIGERFYRVEPSRSKLSGGTGLGLSIVKTIMEIHGGRLDIESLEGLGTTVSLAFPSPSEA